MQLGFGDGWVSAKLGQNEALERLSREVDWDRLAALLGRPGAPGPGRPPKLALMMLKAMLLQQWYGLSDADLEEALNDRISFRRFIGLGLDTAAPDHSTLCRFRNEIAQQGVAQQLFAAFGQQLESRGLILRKGTMIDASLVETPYRPGSPDGTRASVDKDAALTARKGKRGTHFGYKMHAGVDCGSKLIRGLCLTPANVNDTVPADRLVCGDEEAVYADKGYAKQARRNWLRGLGIKARIMHKSWGGGPALSLWQKRHNALIAPIRAEVEGVFATLKRWLGFSRVRYRDLTRNASHLALVGLAYNMKRSLKLT